MGTDRLLGVWVSHCQAWVKGKIQQRTYLVSSSFGFLAYAESILGGKGSNIFYITLIGELTRLNTPEGLQWASNEDLDSVGSTPHLEPST